MSTQEFLGALRAAGISISAASGRLLIEAAEGVVTAKLQAELVSRKADLIAALETPQQRTLASDVLDAQSEVASLLAIAYRRRAKVSRVGTDRKTSGADCSLANSDARSVHGDVL
jgi:hypothetical protein